MENFLYKLVFPECGKLYFGRAANESRYVGNKPNQQFVGPHHNKEVQNLLDAGEFCFFLVVKEFETFEELCDSEEKFLHRVWKTNDWETRPRWLLNRNRNSVGGGGFLHLTPQQVKSFQQSGADSKGGRNNKGNKRPDASERLKGNNNGTKTKGRKRPDVSKNMKGNTYGTKHKGRKNTWNNVMNSEPVKCPHCGNTIGNKAALGVHIKFKHR